MSLSSMKKTARILCSLFTVFLFSAGNLHAQEVEKEKIPEEHLSQSLKNLPWGAQIWDVEEAVEQLKSDEKVLWIDTRPQSFFDMGTVSGAILLPYNQSGKQGNDMTAETR